MAIPASAALSGLLLRNAYSAPPEKPGPTPALVDVIVAAALAFLSQKGLSLFAPELLLPHWAPTQGGIWGLEFLVVVRHVLPPPARQPEQLRQMISLQELDWRREEFDQKVGQIRKGYLVAAALLLLSASFLLIVPGASSGARAGAGLLLGGTSILFSLIRRAWSPSTTVDRATIDVYSLFCKELRRQRALLQWIQCWHFASLIPGILLILWGSRVYSYLVLLPILLMTSIVSLEATKRKREVEEIERTPVAGAASFNRC